MLIVIKVIALLGLRMVVNVVNGEMKELRLRRGNWRPLADIQPRPRGGKRNEAEANANPSHHHQNLVSDLKLSRVDSGYLDLSSWQQRVKLSGACGETSVVAT